MQHTQSLLDHQATAPQANQATAPSLPAHWLLPTTGGFKHYQTPAQNLPKRCRQTRLDAKRVTPELLRLKFYCSGTWNFVFFFLFSLSVCCLVPCLLVHHISLLITLVLHCFSSPSFSFSFFSFFLGFVSFTIVGRLMLNYT
jgi:hypothetical protein